MAINTRIDVTPAEWRALKVLAIQNNMSLQEFIATALRWSDLSRDAFIPTSEEQK